MQTTVQMLIRNEADVIYECLDSIAQWGARAIVILDGNSDDGTQHEITRFMNTHLDVQIHLVSERDPDERFHDHLRNRLLALTLECIPDTDWILSLDADEIYHTSPFHAINVAHVLGANVVRSYVPQFWITVDDVRQGLVVEDQRLSVQERRLWYSWGHMGTFAWKVQPEHFYPHETPKRTPELPGQTWRDWQLAGTELSVCKHYPFRSLPQAVRRMVDRQMRGGRRYFGKYFENWIIDETAAGLRRFDGYFVPECTHERVHQYMGGFK